MATDAPLKQCLENNDNDPDEQNSTLNEEDVSIYFRGTHEVQECLEGQGEADLHTFNSSCTKNPGHTQFIPVKTLTLRHFPSGYQDNDLFDLIKAMSDVTVRLAVRFTSLERPEFISGTTDPYPFYDSRGKDTLRTGTGRVDHVDRYSEETHNMTCPCPECVDSPHPAKCGGRFDSFQGRNCNTVRPRNEEGVGEVYGPKM
ncbi:uncharacterized protein LOC131944242 [Physella acuta]|uniref:uncharacterized protein LOC131944242 n=1 Tax=Physella acuta TaxID=109671 RepID=UPI0027DAD5CB|nr:uncharacterized protein LOC131944242 [Physella acuta]